MKNNSPIFAKPPSNSISLEDCEFYHAQVIPGLSAPIKGEWDLRKGVDEDGHQKAPPLNGTGHTWHHDDKTLHSIIKYGLVKLVKGYEGKMMGFEENLSDKDIDSVLAYIKSYWPKDKYEHQIGISK